MPATTTTTSLLPTPLEATATRCCTRCRAAAELAARTQTQEAKLREERQKAAALEEQLAGLKMEAERQVTKAKAETGQVRDGSEADRMPNASCLSKGRRAGVRARASLSLAPTRRAAWIGSIPRRSC